MEVLIMPVNRSKQGGKLYLVMMIVVIAISLLFGLLPKIFPSFALPDAGEPGDIAMSEAVYYIPVLVFLIIDRFEPLRGMKLRPIGPVSILWTLLFTVLMMPVVVLLNLVTQLAVPNAVAQTLAASTAMPMWVSLIYFAVLPPIVEEFIYRGALFQYFRPCGLWKTALLTGLMFGLAHLNLNQFLYAFVLGIFWAMLDEATGSVYSSMLSHSLVNGINVGMAYIAVSNLPENMVGALEQAEEEVSVSSLSLIYWIVLAVVAGACVVLSILIIRHLAKIRGNAQKFSDALRGKDRLPGKEGKKIFSVQLLLGIALPVVVPGIRMASARICSIWNRGCL